MDYWIANSKNVAARINKFYRRESSVVYPPVEVNDIILKTKDQKKASGPKGLRPGGEDYFLIVSRLVGAKGLEEAAKAFKRLKYKLKIVGEAHGFSDVENKLKELSGGNVELLGRVDDEELFKLYSKAKGFIALAREEDFGMTVVEAMAGGCVPVVIGKGGQLEIIEDKISGYLWETLEDLKELTLKLINEDHLREQMSSNAIDRSKNFSKNKFEESILEIR